MLSGTLDGIAMIYYSIDPDYRTRTYVIIAVISVGIQFAAQFLAPQFQDRLFALNLINPAGLFSFFLLLQLYDRILWHRLPLSKLPDFSGRWVGYILKRQHHDVNAGACTFSIEEFISIEVNISQTYRRLSLELASAGRSGIRGRESELTSAAIFFENPLRPKIIYTWIRQDLSGSAEFRMIQRDNRHFLEGAYLSNHPRLGEISLTRVSNEERWYNAEIEQMHGENGQVYLGVSIPQDQLGLDLKRMKKELGKTKNEVYRSRQIQRDGAGFHMTVVTPDELSELKSAEPAIDIRGLRLWIQLFGLGCARSGKDYSYYCVASSVVGTELRRRLSLPYRDFHITLGFSTDDIHHVSKGFDTLLKTSFWKN